MIPHHIIYKSVKINKVILLLFLIFTACQPAPPAIRLEVPTLAPLPTDLITWTALPPPTSENTPTETFLPIIYTFTPELTATQTITPTITLTPSATLIPPTSTSAPTPTDTQPPPTAAPICNCDRDYNCSDFTTHSEAQACFDSCGGSKTNNWSRLDGSDKDGKVCESLP
jgi:hypothetical protein